ncbi:MAG: hypothetical protein ACK5Q5_02495 [Planctomycetaceae bacterium]
MLAHRPPPARPRHRRGLAPLELTLATPLLMSMMALMVIIGAAGAWKVRASANARQAILRSIYPRTTDNDPKPRNWWPASASLSFHGGGASFLQDDPYANHTAVRGPEIVDPNTGNSLPVLIRTMDMQAGMQSGQSVINHEPAMWTRLGVRNHFIQEVVMFAGQTWQYGNLGFASNSARRILRTYDFEMSRYNPSASMQVRAAELAIRTNPNRQVLAILDRDAELRAHFGNFQNFYPLPRNICSHDPIRLANEVIPRLLADIDQVPQRLASRFLRMYQEQLRDLLAMNPPPADFAARKADLEQKIQQLQDFLATL